MQVDYHFAEVELDDEYGYCFKVRKGRELPTADEVYQFMERDFNKSGYTAESIVAIREITETEVHSFYDDSRMSEWPVLM